jgi:hypothetical protein
MRTEQVRGKYWRPRGVIPKPPRLDLVGKIISESRSVDSTARAIKNPWVLLAKWQAVILFCQALGVPVNAWGKRVQQRSKVLKHSIRIILILEY